MNNIYLNKLVKKIKIKECEYETVKNMIEHYNSSVDNTINDIFVSEQLNKDEVFKTYTCTHIINNITTNNITNLTIPDYDNLINTLYKNLSLKTHPDKNNGDDVDFKLINTSYENKNMLKLIEFAHKYDLLNISDIDINLLTLILEKELISIKNKIKTLKSCVCYQYLINGDSQIKNIIDLHKQNMILRKINDDLSKENEKHKL